MEGGRHSLSEDGTKLSVRRDLRGEMRKAIASEVDQIKNGTNRRCSGRARSSCDGVIWLQVGDGLRIMG